MVITKPEDVTKQGFCKTLWRKLRLRGSLLLVFIPFWGVVDVRGCAPISVWVGVGGGWCRGGSLFEAGRLLTFSSFRMGAYSRWALIRGWALIRINTVLKSIDDKQCVILLLLDRSAAFDTVDHKILLHRLRSRFGIKGKALSWLQSYLTDRSQSVQIDGFTSSVHPLRFCVPQGSVLVRCCICCTLPH